MDNENLKGKVMSNFIWRLGERYFAQIVQFIVSIVLARILLPEVYGTVALITVFITILQVFIDSGLGNALIQKKDVDDVDFSTVFYFNLLMCSLLYLLIFFLAPLIAKFYNNESLTPIIRVLSVSLVISGLKNVQQAYISRNFQFKKFFWATLGGTIVSAFVGIFLALKGFGVWALVAQNLTNLCIDTLILWIIVKWRPKLVFSKSRLKVLFSYGSKLLGSSLIDTVYINFRKLIIGKKYSSSDLAFYEQGEKFPVVIVSNVNASIDSVLLPAMSKQQDDRVQVKNMTRRAIKTSTFIMAPLMIGLAVVAQGVVRLVLTDKWLFCVPFLQIFCIEYMFYPVHTANLNAIKALGRSDTFFKLEIIKKIVGITVLLISMHISVLAIALSTILTSIISILINSFPNKKYINYSLFEQLKDIFNNLYLALIMGVCVWLISFIPMNYILLLFIQIIVGIVIYFTLSLIFKNESFNYIIGIVKNYFKRKDKNIEGEKMEKTLDKKTIKVGIMQPYFCPYIGYFQLMNAVDKYVVYDDVNFIKGGWINRNRILLNGEPHFINIPMLGASPNKLINEVGINNQEVLVGKNLKLLEAAYKKAPYFNDVYPLLKEIFEFKTDTIEKFIFNSFKVINNYLDIKTELIMSSTLDKDNSLRAQDKVLAICKLLNATDYYNAVGGQELYSFEDFKEKDINLHFVKTQEIIYKQFNNEFQSNLSIIDVMMFNSKEEIKQLLNKYELIS